ncbi:hypothetical protein LPJ61_004759 [Coemansia biformis]|uniref:Branchpoint-bridging protein n=1 Tax=Coemansia biformis TaxID=1286918 RepID=A0A9W7Y800_9FUNG|nr:hypothetical protein LPJ61_004759 [Coemansia biformis]
MSWAPTGTNSMPLGRPSRIPGRAPEGQPPIEGPAAGANGGGAAGAHTGIDAQKAVERARAIANSVLGVAAPAAHQPPPPPPPGSGAGDDGERKRRRKNRWGDQQANGAAAAAVTSVMSKDQVENYAAVLRIDEITRRLKTGDVVPPDGQRSPSPPPKYNSEGKRTNTREHRYRRKLEEERMRLVEEQLRRDPGYRPPSDFRRRSRFSEKVFIPVDENPGLNFIGLLIGPRGNTLKKIESESGSKISIRGRGSIKEGKRRDSAHIPGADEDLHCHVVADSEEKVRRGVRLVCEIIQKACVTPEGQNDLKRNQLRELAALNGTLRDDEGQACTNCGDLNHRQWECQETTNVTASLVCVVCNNAGHLSRDCPQRHDPVALQKARERDQQLKFEYLDLMAELGESVPAPGRENGDRPRQSISDRADSTQPMSGARSPGSAPWLRGGRSPARDHDRRRSRSPPPPHPLMRPATPPWLYHRPAEHFYSNGFRDPRPPDALAPPMQPPAECAGPSPWAAQQGHDYGYHGGGYQEGGGQPPYHQPGTHMGHPQPP